MSKKSYSTPDHDAPSPRGSSRASLATNGGTRGKRVGSKRKGGDQGVIKRSGKRVLGVFIDGTALDRAARRLNRKIDLAALVRGVAAGIQPLVARYYTIIPYEDDSRQQAFLDAVRSAGLTVIVKRLPPKGVTRQVSVDLEMATDMVGFGLGLSELSNTLDFHAPQTVSSNVSSNVRPGHATAQERRSPESAGRTARCSISDTSDISGNPSGEGAISDQDSPIKRVVAVVCPSRELIYPIELLKSRGVDTVSVDFGKFRTGDVLNAAAKWVDLSDSESILL